MKSLRIIFPILIIFVTTTPLCANLSAYDSVNVALIDSIESRPKTHVQNFIFLEILGNGGVGSLNYERFLNKLFSVRLGLALLPTDYATRLYEVVARPALLFMINCIIGDSGFSFLISS